MTLATEKMRVADRHEAGRHVDGHMAPMHVHFDDSENPKISELGLAIRKLRDERDALIEGSVDVWSPLGRRAPLLRAAFKDVTLPVQTRYQLIQAMGGDDRVILAPSLTGGNMVVSVVDLVEALTPFLDEVLPVLTWEDLVLEIVKREAKARKGKAGGSRLLRDLGSKNLRQILDDPRRVRKAFPNTKPGEYSRAFAAKRTYYDILLQPLDADKRTKTRSVKRLFSRVAMDAQHFGFQYRSVEDMLAIIEAIKAFLEKNDAVQAGLAKASSATTHLANAEQLLGQVSGLLDSVLAATSLNSTVTSRNQQAADKLESASQLIAQAIADLAAAETAANKAPTSTELANAVAEAQNRLETLQNLYEAQLDKMAQAETHKDVLAIPSVCVTIKCIEDDPCCDDEWAGVNVCVSNLDNPDVPQACGVTNGSGRVTVCGRFGNSSITVTSQDGGDWDETRNFEMGSSSSTFTITTDLPGWE